MNLDLGVEYERGDDHKVSTYLLHRVNDKVKVGSVVELNIENKKTYIQTAIEH